MTIKDFFKVQQKVKKLKKKNYPNEDSLILVVYFIIHKRIADKAKSRIYHYSSTDKQSEYKVVKSVMFFF